MLETAPTAEALIFNYVKLPNQPNWFPLYIKGELRRKMNLWSNYTLLLTFL